MNHNPAIASIAKMAPEPTSTTQRRFRPFVGEIDSFVSFVCMARFPSAQAGADRLFKSNARDVGVEQHVGISRLDVNVASLFGDDVEQSDPAVTVDLANHFEVSCSLLANAAAVGGHPRLCTLVADLVLCNFGTNGEAGGCDAAAGSIDGRCVGGDCALVAVECR